MSGGGGTVRSPPISPSEDMSPFVATGLAFPAAQEARSLLEQMSPKTAIVGDFGSDMVVFILNCLFSMDISKTELVVKHASEIFRFPALGDSVCGLAEKNPSGIGKLSKLVDALNLPIELSITVAVSLLFSEVDSVRTKGTEMIENIMVQMTKAKSFPVNELSFTELLHHVKTSSTVNPKILKEFQMTLTEFCKQNHIPTTRFILLDSLPMYSADPSIDETSSLIQDLEISSSPADFLESIGYSSMNSLSNLKEALSPFTPLREEDVAEIIAMMAATHSDLGSKSKGSDEHKLAVHRTFRASVNPDVHLASPDSAEKSEEDEVTPESWRILVFVQTMIDILPKLDWLSVYRKLDCPRFFLSDQRGLLLLVETYRVARNGNPFPISIMFGKWQNVKGQISLIRECLMAPKILIDFQLSEKFMPPISGIPLPNLAVYHNESPAATIGLQNQAWYSIDLVETLLELAEGNMYFEIQALIQPAVDFLPEHLVCILAQVKNTGVLGDHLLSYLMPLFLRIHPHSGIVIPVLWKANSSLCVEWMGMLYAKESSFLPRILDIAQDLKLMEPLQSILNAPPFSFAIDLATLASRREFLNLEKWLKTRIEEHGAFFVNDCVDFMKDYLEYATNGTAPNRHCVTLMSPDIIETFSRCILNFSGFTPSQKEQVNQLFRGCMQVPGTRHESIEKEANSYFQKIYDSSLSIEEMIVQLKAFRESSDPRQREVYEVMIHSLFDEYRFFRKYPLKELQITGELFGSLIANDLLIEDNLELALRNVIECMSNPADSKLYQFGIWALEQFSFRVRQWPQFLQQLLSIPHFAVTNPELASACRGIPTHLVGASLPAEVPAREPTRVEVSKAPEPVAPVDTRPSFASALALQFPGSAELAKIDTDDLLHCRGLHVWTSLSTIVRDRLSLLLNSVALNNVSDKSQELIAILRTPDIVQQFVHYVVSKRVSNEPNNHEVYLILLRKTEVDGVMREAVLSTYYCINFLLSSALVISPGNERNFLKHLGIWLGELTVAVNRPPFAKYLDLKKLVLVAYRTGHFQVVLFLVCKVLLGCSKSKIFKPPNPWLMSLASLLAEAHQLTELKANTRFEIELLFNRLQVEVDDIQIRGVFAQSPTRSLPLREEAPDIGLHGSGAVAPGEASESGIFVSPSLGQLAANPHVRDIIFMSLDATIREVVHSVVDSPVSIACITTKELILKDFAVEPDENKMRLAAHYMVQNLAGNLAVFSGKDLLLDVFMKRLKEFLTQHLRLSTSESLEDAVRVIARDNFDLACSFIDRTAKERAIEKIDETLAHQYYIRKRHAETGSPFQDPAALTASGGFPASLPDVLRPKLRLTPQQLKVYQDFALPPRTQEAQVPLSIEPSIAPGPDYAARDPAVQELHAAQKHMELVLQVIDEIIVQLSKEDPVTILRDSKLNQAISSVSSILSRLGSAQRQQMAIAFSQRVMSMLIEPSVPLHMEVCLMLLKAVRVAYPEIPRELTMMLLRALDVQVLNLDAVAGLIREGLIIVPQLDATFARLLPVAGHPSVFQSIIGFLNRSIVIERAVLPADFQLTLECLTRLSSRLGPELGEQIGLLLDRCRTVMSRTEPSSEMIGSAVSGDRHFSQQCFTLFDEWVNIYVRHPKIPEKLVFQFLTAFEQEGMMKSSLSIDAFFGVLTPACLAAAASKDAPFEFIDSLSKLVVVLVDVMRPSISTGKLSGSVILSSFLNILTDLIIRNSETQGEGFDQKPYFRLYSSLIQDLCVSDDPSHPVEIDDLLTFSSALNRVSPIHVPSFCFSWLQLIAHRFFMPSILLTKNPRCFVHFQNLLIDLFKFLERFLRKAELTDSILLLYRGTIRVLLILLHDFPEFLCEFHFSFCDVIPPTCIQLRNMVLSAFPRNMRLPDPFLPNLKVDLLAEIKVEPKIRSETTTILAYKGINKDIDLYLKKRGVPTIFDDLVDKMFLSAEDAAVSGTVYNTPLMNALVLYIGMQEIRNSKQDQSTELVSKEAMELFLNIVLRLDEEGRYHFFNGITNQLRFPNSHTYYFSCILLFLFSESPSETIREQITKILLERIIVHRPHPWGLLITFIELIKNSRYNLLGHEFTKCATEIENLFDSVARSCFKGSNQPDES